MIRIYYNRTDRRWLAYEYQNGSETGPHYEIRRRGNHRSAIRFVLRQYDRTGPYGERLGAYVSLAEAHQAADDHFAPQRS